MRPRLAAALALLALALGCAHQGGPPPAAAPEAPYVIGQSDELEVQVWQEPDLSRTVTVRCDGRISLPLLDDVKAEGLTPRQLREQLSGLYARLVTDPVVSVLVVEPLSATFFITGKVARPGEYPLLKQTSVLQAIATAGGFTEWAKRGKITLIRQGGLRRRLDYDRLVAGDTSQEVALERGDTLVVP